MIAQTLNLIAGNMVVWYSLTVGTYLAAMGIGTILYGSKTAHRTWSWNQLFTIEVILSLAGASAVLALRGAHSILLNMVMHASADVGRLLVYAVAFGVTALIGVLTGMELPLLIHLGNAAAGGRTVTNRVLGWDYLGALGAAVVFPLLLVPYLPLHVIGFGIATLNLMVAGAILVRLRSGATWLRGRGLVIVSLGASLVAAFVLAPRIEQLLLKSYYFYYWRKPNAPPHQPPVRRIHSPYQKIDIVHDPNPVRQSILRDAYSTKFSTDPSKPRDRYLFLNGDLQVSSNYEEIYHEWFAHVPIIINGKVPHRVLVMGGGDGLLHHELLKYDEIQSIVHVDIDDRLVNLAKTNSILAAMNEHSLDDPRVHTVFSDAFQYMRSASQATYDAIYLDFPFVRGYDLARLYSSEFYYFVRERLADDGFVALDAPLMYMIVNRDADGNPIATHGGTWDIHFNTMRRAGFKTVLPFYSNLEADNPLAYEALVRSAVMKQAVLNPANGLHDELAKWNWMLQFVARFASRHRNSFIMLRKDERYGPFRYIDFGIELHVLNEKRFAQSFPGTPSPTVPIDLAKVNSILRPRLPLGGVGNIRVPW